MFCSSGTVDQISGTQHRMWTLFWPSDSLHIVARIECAVESRMCRSGKGHWFCYLVITSQIHTNVHGGEASEYYVVLEAGERKEGSGRGSAVEATRKRGVGCSVQKRRRQVRFNPF